MLRGNASQLVWPQALPLFDSSFTRPGHFTEQVTEISRLVGPASPDPGGTPGLIQVPVGTPGPGQDPGGSSGPGHISSEYSGGERGVSPALSHPFRASPSFSGPSSPGLADSEPGQAIPNWPRALPRRGLKSRLLRIKTNAGLVRPVTPRPAQLNP